MKKKLYCLIGLSLLLSLSALPAFGQKPNLVSVRYGGDGSASAHSRAPSVSSDGRFVAFESTAFNLTGIKDENGRSDVFVRDLRTGVTKLVSVNTSRNAAGRGDSTAPVISASGRFVTFQSDADDLVANDFNNDVDVFVRDLQTNTTALVSINELKNGAGNAGSIDPVISADGRFVTFESWASDLCPNDANGGIDVFVRDLQAGTTSLVSVNKTGTGSGNGPSYRSGAGQNTYYRKVISQDGRFVVFESQATNLVSVSDNNGGDDVFVRDMTAGVTSLVSISSDGTESLPGGATLPVISADGSVVAFEGYREPPNSFNWGLFARNLKTGVTTFVAPSHPSDPLSPVLSADGRLLVFVADSDQLVATDTNGGHTSYGDVFVRNLQTGVTELVSVNKAGTDSAGGTSMSPAISADGRFVAFLSDAENLAAGVSDTNGSGDVFARDLLADKTTLVSVTNAGTASARGTNPVISGNGHFVFFESSSGAIVPGDTNQTVDVFATALNGAVRLSPVSNTVNESAGTATIQVTRSNGAGAATVYYTTGSAGATSGSDFTASSGALTFAEGETVKTFAVAITDDITDENNEQVRLTVSDFAPGSAVGSLSTGTLTIVDDDPPPTITISDARVTEGNTGTVKANFTISLSAPSSKEVSVALSAAVGTAGGDDFRLDYSLAVFGPGQLTQTVPVIIYGDTLDEADEVFTVSLARATNATIARARGVGSIVDNDPTPTVTITNATVTEPDSDTVSAFFVVKLSAPSGRTVSVKYATANGTSNPATAGTDYTALALRTLTFSPGETAKTITVAVKGDLIKELNETFFVNLSGPVNATVADGQGQGTILNDD